MDNLRDLLNRLPHAGRSLGMHKANNLDRIFFECLGDLFGPDDLTSGCFDSDHFSAAALDNIRHARAENAVDTHQDRISLLD